MCDRWGDDEPKVELRTSEPKGELVVYDNPFMKSGAIRRVLLTNPFDVTEHERDEVEYIPLAPLAYYVEDLKNPITIAVNGQIVPKAEWYDLIPAPTAEIVISPIIMPGGGHGGGGGIKQIIGLVLAIAVAVLVPVLTPVIGAVAASLVGAAITITGGILMSALAPKPRQTRGPDDSPTYGWNGPTLTARQGIPIPKGYGVMRVSGNVITSYVYTQGNKQYMNILLSFGHGYAKSISQIKINDNNIENYKGIQVEKRLGYNEQSITQYFHDIKNEYAQSQKLTGGSPFIVNGKRADTQAVEVEFTCPKGLYAIDANGEYQSQSETVALEWSPTGAGTWTSLLAPRTTTAVTSTPYWIATSQEQFAGGPNSIIVHATANNKGDHYDGEPFSASIGYANFDQNDASLGTDTRNWKGTWVRNPLNAQAMKDGGDGGVGSSIGGAGGINQTPQIVQTWKTVSGVITGNQTTPIRHTLRADNLPPGQYDFRITKWTGENSNVNKVAQDVFLTGITEIAYTDVAYTGMILMAVRAMATDQLSGQGINITAVIDYGNPETQGYKWLVAGDRPQGYFRFDETSGLVCNDSSGRGTIAAYSASGVTLQKSTLIKGSPSKAVAFDGVNGKITVTSQPVLGTDYTIETWLKPTVLGGNIAIDSASGDGFKLDATGKLNLRYSATDHLSATVLQVGVNYHVAVNVKAGTATFLINGVKDANTYASATSLTLKEAFSTYSGTADEVAYYAPSILMPRMAQRYTWGTSRHNILENYSGDNPAVVDWDLLTSPVHGGGMAFSLMDELKFKEWGDFNGEQVSDGNGGFMNRHSFNGVFDQDGNLWDAVQSVASMSRASVMRTGQKYTVCMDKPVAAPVQLFSVANILDKSFKQTWIGLTDRANSLDINYLDRDNGYARTQMTVELDTDISSAADIKKAHGIDLFGVTNAQEVYRHGRYRLLLTKKLKQTIEFDAFIDAIACTVGDVIRVQHDLPQWAIGGRCAKDSPDLLTLKLDQSVTLKAGRSYGVLVPFAKLQRYTGTITSIDGDLIFLSGYTGQTDIKRLVSGSVEVSIIGTGSNYVQVSDPTGLVASNPYGLWDTDVLNTRVMAVPGADVTTDTLTVTAAFDGLPAQFQMFAFYEIGSEPKLFRVTNISRSADLERTITALEYDATVYTDAEPPILPTRKGYPLVGPISGVTAADNAASGTRAWTNPANALLNDGVFATAINTAVNTDENTHLLRITGFNPAFDKNDIVTGIRVDILKQAIADVGGFVVDVSVQLVVNGVAVGTPKTIAANWSSTLGYTTYGADVDLWGTAGVLNTDWTLPNTGVEIKVRMVTANGVAIITQAKVDHVRMSWFVSRGIAAQVTTLKAAETYSPYPVGGVYIPSISASWLKGKKTYGTKVYAAVMIGGVMQEEYLIQDTFGTAIKFPVQSGNTYRVRVVGYDQLGQPAPYQTAPTADVVVVGKNALPNDVLGLKQVAGSLPNNASLVWNAPGDTFDHYELRWGATQGVTWLLATVVNNAISNAVTTLAGLTNGPGVFMLKEIKVTGEESFHEARVVVSNTASSDLNGQGSIPPTTGQSGPFTYDAKDNGTDEATLSWTWVDDLRYRSDQSPFTVPNSYKQWNAIPPAPSLSAVAGGAKASAACFGRVAYCKDGMIVCVGRESTITPAINQVVQFAAPGNPVPRSNSIVFSDTFTNVAGTLLSAHDADWIKADATNDFKIDATGVKIQLTTASTAKAGYFHNKIPQNATHTVQCDLDISASAVNGDYMGVTVMGSDLNNQYFISIRGNQVMRIEKKVGGVVTVIQADTAIASKVGTVKVIVSPNALLTGVVLACYWNNVLIFTLTDTALGKFVIGAKCGIAGGVAAAAFWDNFSIDDGLNVGNPASTYDGWIPMLGTATGIEHSMVDPRTPLAFNVGFTESTAGATHLASFTLGLGPAYNTLQHYKNLQTASTYCTGFMASGTKGDVGGMLAASTTYRFYSAIAGTDPFFTMRMFGGAYPSTIDILKQTQINSDGWISESGDSGMTAITPAVGGTVGGGGGGCPAEDSEITPLFGEAQASPFFNENWVIVRAKNGAWMKGTPRSRIYTNERGLVSMQDFDWPVWSWTLPLRLRRGLRWITTRWLTNLWKFDPLTAVTDHGDSEVVAVERLKEPGRALTVNVLGVRLYWCGGPGSPAKFLKHNRKPL